MIDISHEELREAAIPMIKLLCDKCHPHVTVLITPTSVELLESNMTDANITEFVKD